MTEPTTPQQQNVPAGRLIWVLLPLLCFAVLVLGFVIALNSGDPSKLPSVLINKAVPKTTFASIPGLRKDQTSIPGFSSADLKAGKISVVNFWASWCGPCIEEHPILTKLAGQTDVNLYGVNYKDKPVDARRFLNRFGNPFTAIGADPDGRAAIEWGVYGMPETFVIDGEGKIIYKHVGPISQETLANKIIPVIRHIHSLKSDSQTGEK